MASRFFINEKVGSRSPPCRRVMYWGEVEYGKDDALKARRSSQNGKCCAG